jgi:hypothetical protein
VVCATCADRSYRVHPWLCHIDNLYSLIRGGFPFRRNELTIEEWLDMGVYKQLLDDEREAMRMRMLLFR